VEEEEKEMKMRSNWMWSMSINRALLSDVENCNVRRCEINKMKKKMRWDEMQKRREKTKKVVFGDFLKGLGGKCYWMKGIRVNETNLGWKISISSEKVAVRHFQGTVYCLSQYDACFQISNFFVQFLELAHM